MMPARTGQITATPKKRLFRIVIEAYSIAGCDSGRGHLLSAKFKSEQLQSAEIHATKVV